MSNINPGFMPNSINAVNYAFESGTIADKTRFRSTLSGYPSTHLPRMLVFGCSIAQQCNSYLHSTTSTVTAETRAGLRALPVANGALFTAGQSIAVPLYNARIYVTSIESITANVLTLTIPLPGLVRSGSSVTINTRPTQPDTNLGYGAVNAGVALIGGPVEVVPSYGYGGAIFTQMFCDLERDLRYYQPKYVALHMYENDLTGSVASGAATLDQMIGWARTMARLCLDYGATPIVYSSMPYYNSSTGVGIPASRAADYDGLAAYLGSGTSGQLAIDVPGAWGDNSLSTGWLDTSNPVWPRAPLPGWTDGVHPVTSKRFAVGLIAAPVLAQMLPEAHSIADLFLTSRDVSLLVGTGGVSSNLQAGSIVPRLHTIAAYGTAVSTTSRRIDGSLQILTTWSSSANRTADYVIDRYTFTFPGVYSGGTMRFKAVVRMRINVMVGIAQVFPQVTLSTGENHTGQTGIDMCASMPADGRIIELETPVFAIGVGATTCVIELMLRPTTAASPANAVLDVDVIEMGLIAAHPETPHTYV